MGQRTRRTGAASTLVILCSLGIVSLVVALTPVPATAASGINVFVGYADSLRANATNFPTPWAGSPQTTFEGCLPVASCEYDGGAIRVENDGRRIAQPRKRRACLFHRPRQLLRR